MKLGERQEVFAELVPRLLDQAHKMGFAVRCGSLFRDPRLHGHKGHPDLFSWLEQNFPDAAEAAFDAGYRGYGSRVSLHKDKCAIDLNLRTTADDHMCWSTEEHRKLGEWWEAQHPMCRWGGRYNDGNHYEFLEWRES
jgi:hypothetical protein